MKRITVVTAMLLLSALMLAGCARTPVFEDCPFEEGQILDLKDEIGQVEGWNGPPSINPTRTHFLFKEEGVLKAKRIGYLPQVVSSLEVERDVLTYRLCEGVWLRVSINYSEGFISSETAWFKAGSFQ